MYKHTVYRDALDKLWKLEREARRARNDYWALADDLIATGLVSVEDVAEIWGVHPGTARKRMQQWRDRIRGVDNDQGNLYADREDL